MRLTTRGRYAVTALLDIALQPENKAITLNEIATRQSISVTYLEQLFAKLKKHDIVVSIRGANGGYHLAHSANNISILQIIEAVDESVDATRCDHQGNCQNGAMCLTHDLWRELTEHVASYLSNLSLSDLLQKDAIQKVALRQLNSTQTKTVSSAGII